MTHVPNEVLAHPSVLGCRTQGLYAGFGKRLVDLAGVALVLPIGLPVIVAACLLVLLDGGRPIYGQPRIGRNGQVFRCWKIRTMVPDAEEALARLLRVDPRAAREWEEAQKLESDPRITRIGRHLRRLSIDELPQLWNVALGQMSLIGPRPFTPEQKALYDAVLGAGGYYRLRPGISGLWQVEARNGCSFRGRVRFDDAYARDLSPRLDAKIFLKTLKVVVSATGK